MSATEVDAYLDTVTPRKRARDARTLVTLMREVTGHEPDLHGTIIGFGRYHYEYESGRRGDGPAAAFSPRKAASTVYVPDGVGAHAGDLARLGPHTTGVGCIYLKDLDEVDLDVLTQIVRHSYATLTRGTYGLRAREGGTS
ncbi:DUF1801 domain-containing protein [Jiangella mangrovi]|uniref:YdhG-like domain-containing protein n=1 Tax=Jiangella mangrovi TaxID=1524084 RepID=A0A7W9GPF3_9ACTN|nr:DUF1801 domain-containing protein [Jiangella mangrovi]MBB5787639.1 hypothetical protein [Jiangella mangrovi]